MIAGLDDDEGSATVCAAKAIAVDQVGRVSFSLAQLLFSGALLFVIRVGIIKVRERVNLLRKCLFRRDYVRPAGLLPVDEIDFEVEN